MNTNDCDVLIIGAGMAGSCLARQLKLRLPELKVILIDKNEEFDYWVGESTVEMWDHYMTSVLGLGPYLERYHMQKHGLRFFFDNEEHSLPVDEMSEFGRSSYHAIPARQIDRSRFDMDMVRMNRELGVDVRLGVKVLNSSKNEKTINIDRENGHTVITSQGDFRCRWLVDSGGRNSPITRQLNLIKPNEDLVKGSYWCRYQGGKNIDDLGSDSWRARVNHTQRFTSTNHFMYRGYWIWHIAISDDIVSIGVEYDKNQVDLQFSNGDEFEAWLRTHKSMDQILDGATQLDFFGLKKISYCTEQFFSTDRWFLTGLSGSFSSVLGSSTSRVYSMTNMLLEEAIRSDLKGDGRVFEKEVRHFNIALNNVYQSTIGFLNNLDRNGSFDVWKAFFNASLALYFNSNLPSATSNFAKEISDANSHGDHCGCHWEQNSGIQLRFKIAQHADTFRDFLDQKDLFYAENKAQFCCSNDWEERADIADKIYQPRDTDKEHHIAQDVYRYVCRYYLMRMASIEHIAFNEDVFDRVYCADWRSDISLTDMFNMLKEKASHPMNDLAIGQQKTPADWFHHVATHYVEAQVLFHLNQVGVFELLDTQTPLTAEEIAAHLNLDVNYTRVLLEYVNQIDDILSIDETCHYRLSEFGQEVINRFSEIVDVTAQEGADTRKIINMFDVRVGAYGPVWSGLTSLLNGDASYGKDIRRNGKFAENGVFKISGRFWPSLTEHIDRLQLDAVVEVGLTTGLIEKLSDKPFNLTCFGIDHKAQAIENAAMRLAERNSDNSVQWLCSDVFDTNKWVDLVRNHEKGMIFSLHFHELIAKGEDQFSNLLKVLKAKIPGWYLLAFEQPLLSKVDAENISDTLWRYSQSNVLIHHLIGNGKILPKQRWIDIGYDAGCQEVSVTPCNYLGYQAFLYRF